MNVSLYISTTELCSSEGSGFGESGGSSGFGGGSAGGGGKFFRWDDGKQLTWHK